MKILSYLLLGTAALTLAACGSSSGSGAGAAVKPPTYKPANAAPKADVDQFFKQLKDSEKVLPSTTLIFKSDMEDHGETAEDRARESAEELVKLSAEGKIHYQNVQDNCVISDPGSAKTGELTGPGSTEKTVKTRSTSGAQCPLVITENLTKTARLISKTATTNHVAQEGQTTLNMKVKDAKLAKDSGLIEATAALKYQSTTETSGEGISQSSKMTFAISGTVSYTVANETITGTMTSNSTTNFEGAKFSGGSQSVVEFNMKAGVIRLVMISDDKGSRAYLNGEEVDPKEVSTILTN